LLQFITATTSTTSYPGTQSTQTQEIQQQPTVAIKEPPTTTSKFRDIRQPPTKRRNDQPEPTFEPDSVVVPGKTFLHHNSQFANQQNLTKLCEQERPLQMKTIDMICAQK
jgi:hypothetical protein